MKEIEELSLEEIAVIEKKTGGIIQNYKQWIIKGKTGENNPTVFSKPENEENILDYLELNNSFCSKNGAYVGNLQKAQWYINNNLKVCEEFPNGVALIMDENENHIGYVGYTHRGACKFLIGDKIFDENYEPKEEDYTKEQWGGWVKEYNDGIAKAEADNDTWWAEDIKRDGISRFIPFKLRGAKTIETMEEALQAAKNMSNHLS